MEQESTKRSRKSSGSSKPYRKYLAAVIILALLAGGGYYGYTWYQNRQASPEAEAQAAEEEKQAILAELSKLMVLPEGDPVLFKVNNEETMRKQQAFFKDTKNDDVLLVFQASSKAIIYRPSTKMIVNVGPINFDQEATGTNTGNTTNTNTESTNTQ